VTKTEARPRLAVTAVLAAWALPWFGSALWGGTLLYFRDLIQYFYPWRRFWSEEVRAGSWPLWDPYAASGTPFLANPNNLSFYPLGWLQAFLPFDLAFNWMLVLSWLLAQAGAYRLGRRLGLERAAALLAAIAYGGSGYGVSILNLPNVLVAAAAAPWMGWAALGVARRAAARDAALFGAATALCLLGGEPVALGISLAGSAAVIFAGGGTAGAPVRRRAAAGLAAAALAAALAAPLLIPALEMLHESERAEGLSEALRARWELTPFEAAAMALPRLGGEPITYDPGRNWSVQLHGELPLLVSTYAGIPLLSLAVFGWWGLAARGRWLVAGAVFLCAGAAASPALPLFKVLDRLGPLLSAVRYPSKFLLGVFLPLAILAGFGAQRVWRGGDLHRLLKALPLIAALGLTVLLLVELGTSGGLSARICETLAVPAAGRHAAVRGIRLSAGVALVLALSVAALAGPLRGKLRPLPAATAWLALVAGDLWVAQATLVPRAPAELFHLRPLVHDAPGGAQRVFRDERPAGFSLRTPDAAPVWGYLWDRATLARGTASEARIVNVLERPVDYLWPAATARLRRWVLEASPQEQAAILRRLGVTTWLSFHDAVIPGTEEISVLKEACRPPLRLRRILDPLPGVFWVERPGEAADPAALRRGLASVGGPDAWLEPLPGPARMAGDRVAGPAPASGAARGRCEILERNPNRVELRCEAERAGLAVLLDSAYPGWEVRVNGIASDPLRVNGAYRGVMVPPGRNAVIWRYRPVSLMWGRILGLAGVATLAAAASIRPVGRQKMSIGGDTAGQSYD
jgi:hypothetical protein